MMAHFEETLFQDLANIIGQGKRRAIAQVNSVLTLTYWQVGKGSTSMCYRTTGLPMERRSSYHSPNNWKMRLVEATPPET